ncbi:TraR/DksA family transcriptional regulator [Oceanicella actignis]|uniref:Transcriptional regulator, TraR/DksA family n=1 Tax=Oceanicella actignis TaxID=1189325 RepID=A0A1M7SDL4_9RHOB|nr:TraR/DksA C4-type zinc finger protein [Oceanicella actignis]SET24575.1 transcriptional regulator, TraR/DksA family [Oceanicella actignis]SHN56607.1 transcriptional regulator, TraR/DksA family [Oceanicella actignis]
MSASEPDPEELRRRFLPRLQAERAALAQASQSTEADRRPVELDQQSVGRLSRMDAMQQQAMARAQEARRRARIRALDAAIRRIGTEDYGWCDSCGEFIGEERLALDPALTRCRACAR